MRLTTVTVATFVAALSGCTDADLYRVIDPANPMLRMRVDAELCEPEAAEDPVPYKILFVIDTSLSNKWNDAGEHRKGAYLTAVEEHGDDATVSFGLVTFSDSAHRPLVTFSQSTALLTTAASALGSDKAAGGTNYEDALTEMMKFINDDLNAVDVTVARRTRYIVYWVSDGNPTFGTRDAATLAANVTAIRTDVTNKADNFVLHTLYLESTGVYETDDEITEARALLSAMAEAGGGTFTNINRGAEFAFDIDPRPLVRPYELVATFARNAHALYGPNHPLPDSDGDGLSDEQEYELGLDPRQPDTDGDGYRDGVEVHTGWQDATHADSGCDSPQLDRDGDGLRDCEEDVLGTSSLAVDTDGDFLPDIVETITGLSPLDDEAANDSDLDRIEDWDEVVAHLDPMQSTTSQQRELWAYRYNLAEATALPDGRSCWNLGVKNIGVFETLATDGHPQGGQVLEVIAVYQTEDRAFVRFERARFAVGFLLPDVRTPVAGNVELTAQDFVPVLIEDAP